MPFKVFTANEYKNGTKQTDCGDRKRFSGCDSDCAEELTPLGVQQQFDVSQRIVRISVHTLTHILTDSTDRKKPLFQTNPLDAGELNKNHKANIWNMYVKSQEGRFSAINKVTTGLNAAVWMPFKPSKTGLWAETSSQSKHD